ncbi:sensor histidine kinase [Azonexus sp.]|uniref:sensor histidine kinase n=1 Tax=Azonexus sp. TaxID=1872668 RepID=UPI0027BA417A|nr:sensor histidine kinase [Azonexus sp.]
MALLLLCVLQVTPPAHATTCPQTGTQENSRIAHQDIQGQALLRDPGGRLSIEEIVSPAQSGAFIPLAGQLTGGFTRDVLWLRFCLTGADDAQPSNWLRVSPAQLDKLTLYLPRGDNYEVRQSGDKLPFSEREWPYRLFTFSIPPDIDSSRPAYLRIESSDPSSLHLDRWTDSSFKQMLALDYLIYGINGGTILLLSAFALIAWLRLREYIYLLYGINALASAILLLVNAGFGSQFLYPASGNMNDLAQSWLTGPVIAVHFLFFTYIFAIRRNLPWLYPVMLALAASYFISAPLSLVLDWHDIRHMLNFAGLPIAALGIPLVIYLGWKDKERRLYSLAFMPWLGNALMHHLHRRNWLDSNFLLEYGTETATLVHLIMFPALLIHRTWRIEREKEVAWTREKMKAQRIEHELEERVTQRTAELQKEIQTRSVLQEQLEEALNTERSGLARQRQLVAMLSHEFRTPLAIIDAAAQRLDRNLVQREPELVGKTSKIRKAVSRLLNLLENCLADERLTADGASLRLEEIDVRAFIQETHGDDALAGARRIQLELPDTPILLRCDRHLFDVTLNNLVDNALKYSPKDRPVLISLMPNLIPGMIAIRVRDYGEGIRPEDRERVFDKFIRADGLTGISGAGLGLYLARELARRHGGNVVLEPATPGEGASFILSLPA